MSGEQPTRHEQKGDREATLSVKDAFAAALEALDEGGDLAAVLEDLDDAMRGAVESLLAAHGRAAGKLLDATDDTQTGWSGLRHGAAEQGIEIEPPQIEGYEIGEEIGRGGFGVVYRAMQRVPVDREVAVKLLRHELASHGVIRRFRAEGRLLARMNHPGIARVLDAGLDRRGRPYVVMELVRGLPITSACDERSLNLRERVSLMTEVCEAVHHAHQRAIIHRDLKPANMMVEEVDGVLRPRVIDFGIAKLLDDDDGHTATIAGDRLGTPKYMSPEQREGGDSADVRTDVYALGIVLCEVLTGKVPGLRDAGSDAGSGLGSELRSNSRSSFGSGVKPSALAEADPKTAARAKLLKGDLDRIVLKATARYPESRYPSAMAMAQDLRRYLGGLPVTATPPGPVYLARKFVGRHKAVATLAAMLLVALTGTVAALSYGAREARQGQLAAVDALSVAEEERLRAETMSSFLLGNMLTAIDPDLYQGEDRSLQDILRTTANEARTSLAKEPAVLLEVLERVGQSQRAIGDTLGATDTLTQAAVLSGEQRGPGDAGTIELRLDIMLARVIARQPLNYAAEISTLQRLAEANLPPEHATRYRVELYQLYGLPQDERATYAKRMEQRIAASSHRGSEVHFEAMRYLANILLHDEPAAALDIAERALEDAVDRYGLSHSQTVEIRFTYAQALNHTGHSDEAEHEYLLLLDHAQALGGDQSLYYQTALTNVIRMLRDRGEIAQALGLAAEQVNRAREQHGEISPQFRSAMRQVALCHHAAGNWEEAESAFLRALGTNSRFDRSQMLTDLDTRIEFAEMLRDAERWDQTVQVLRPAIEKLPPGHNVRTRATRLTAEAMEAMGQLEEGLLLVERELSDAEGETGQRPAELVEWLEASG